MTGQAIARGSILRQLVMQLLAGAAVLAVLLFFIVQNFARQLAEESQDNILAASVTSILDAAAVEGGELTLDLPYSAFSMLANLNDDRVFYAIHADEAFLTGYEDLPVADITGAASAGYRTTDYQGEELRIVSAARRISVDGNLVRLTATVGQTRSGQRITLVRISRYAAALGLGFFLTAALFAVISARSAIVPLQRLAGSVTRRGPQDLRPVTAPVPAEMVSLVAALNRFMDRLRTSLSRSEDFIAEAAHRVRTPLATVRTQAEITLRRVEKEENRKSLREMIRAIDESSRAAGQLLDHAMVTFRTDHLDEQVMDLAQLSRDMVDRLGPLAELRDITLDARAPSPVLIRGDAILIQNALGNLLDNAIKYSPVDGTVCLTVAANDDRAVVTVRDSGAGFPPGNNADLTRRFARGSNVEGVVGSGLGLTIVDEVTRAHDGTMVIANSQKGPGACVTLSFPLA